MSALTQSMTTMIGSLPEADPAAAIEALAAHPLSIPAWPQLPKRSFREGMILQYAEGFPGIAVDEADRRVWLERTDGLIDDLALFYDAVAERRLDHFRITAASAAGLHAFLGRAAAAGTRLPAAKGQVVGPLTFGLGLADATGRAVWFDEMYRDAVLKGLTMKALWMAARLKSVADTVVIFLDEPIFSALGTPAYLGIGDDVVVASLKEIADALHEEGVEVGVHCCGNMEWSLLVRAGIDVISFDAYGFGDRLALYPEAVAEFLGRGGSLAWGMAPTGTGALVMSEGVDALVARTETLERAFAGKGIDRAALRRQRIFTPSCGMGNLTTAESARVLATLRELGARMRDA